MKNLTAFMVWSVGNVQLVGVNANNGSPFRKFKKAQSLKLFSRF
jgi:hypothetical protein